MSRPLKDGLDYFPHDTMAHADPKMASLMALYGTDGYAFYFILLELIFRAENGRITIGKPAEKAGLAHAMCLKLQRFEQILKSAIELNCFNETEYRENATLTSNGINKRLDKIQIDREKDRKRKDSWREKESTKEKEEKEKEKEKAKNGKPPENHRKTSMPLGTPLSDDDFIQALEKNAAYVGINIKKELAKMDAWLLTPNGRGRKKTKRFILNWLNKIDVPLKPEITQLKVVL